MQIVEQFYAGSITTCLLRVVDFEGRWLRDLSHGHTGEIVMEVEEFVCLFKDDIETAAGLGIWARGRVPVKHHASGASKGWQKIHNTNT
ncbi:hypothetical protein CKAH01_16536 [Colletotrichum kahawae]|uniref:Uncharacterized protein n=1 Tax=Colletotrichum kahawae TaxID=34407 RepID=A0AAD9YCX7_COLKA|nr:hypothetical protein CKAH01_16536 [Colletotrichum kahawae]